MQATDDQLPGRRLVRASVSGVLGEYDHEIEFDDGEAFVIIYGPNGVGKTRFLEVIQAASELRVSRLASLPFESAELRFSDGSCLAVEKSAVPLTLEGADDGSGGGDLAVDVVTFRLAHNGGAPIESTVTAGSDFEHWLQAGTQWEPVGGDVWRDANDGELVHVRDLQRQYRQRFQSSKRTTTGATKLRDEIVDFCDGIEVKFIETQRLTAIEATSQQYSPRLGMREPRHPMATIVHHSERIKTLLDANLAANSRLTQRLDSTFPRRMLDRGDASSLSEAALREKWNEQTTRRARLTTIADLGVDPELSLPDDELNSWQLSMLELFLEDADEKLASFSSVLSRIDLLEEVINSRLLRKSLVVSASGGLEVKRDSDGSSIPLTALSSGEQHEMILLFDLLFNVEANSVVLIDEPEISLHIGWQKLFIADVLRISGLVGFQFVVATHSPQIIDRWWGRAKRLGPTDHDFLGADEAGMDA